jgi:hypothetical protein
MRRGLHGGSQHQAAGGYRQHATKAYNARNGWLAIVAAAAAEIGWRGICA